MKSLILLIFMIISTSLKSQFCVGLNGEVTDYFTGKGIKDVKVILKESNVIISSGYTRKKGFYAFELDSGKVYTIESSKKDMVSKKFIIDTRGAVCTPDVFYDAYLQITMFKSVDGFDFSLFEIPIAMASYKPSIKNISWETGYTEKIRPTLDKTMEVYEKSVNMYYLRKEDEIPSVALNEIFDTIPQEAKKEVIELVENIIEEKIDPPKLNYNDNDSIFEVESSKGLFFTVQVGVYTTSKDLKKIFKIDNLNSELLLDKKIRYTSGRFISTKTADAYRKEMIRLGVKDAFITAYYEGKRIKISEANDLIEKEGTDILIK